jgi:hypothetical protein
MNILALYDIHANSEALAAVPIRMPSTLTPWSWTVTRCLDRSHSKHSPACEH